MKKLIILLSIFFSCAQHEDVSGNDFGLRRRNIEDYHLSNGVERYFLPDFPTWINFSESSQCYLDKTNRYFNFKSLISSFGIDYESSVQLQLLFNIEMEKLKSAYKIDHISFEQEEKLFYTQTDRIQAGIRQFQEPKYKRIHLVWIDQFLNSKKKNLKSVLDTKDMSKGHPIFVSKCLSYYGVKKLLSDNDIDDKNIRIISSELFSPYDKKGNLTPHLGLDFNELFEKGKKLHFFSKKRVLPIEFRGKFRRHKL